MVFKLPKFILFSVLIFGFLSIISLLTVFVFFPELVSAVDVGPNFPVSVVDDASIGTSSWATAGNVTASDNAYASATLAPSEISHYLKATDFGFSIPGGATIDGILVEWEVLGTTGINDQDNAARIVKGGTIGATDRSNPTAWTSSDTFLSHGGAADLWGTTWTPADINASNFGAALSVIGDPFAPSIVNVDSVRITVTYTVATVSISGTVYTDEGVTTMGAGRTVSVSINGAAAAANTTTAINGTYTLSGLTVNAGNVLTLYLDNNTEKGVTVTVGDGANLANIDIYQNDLITRCDNTCSLTNANLDTADNNADADISSIYSVSGSNLTLASGKSLFIPITKTFAPGGDIAVGLNFTNNGTYTKGTETITLSDTSVTPKFFKGGGGSYHNLAITGGGTGALTVSGNNSFNDMTIGAPKTVTFTSGSTQTIAGTFNAAGSLGNLITINASVGGNAANLSKVAGVISTNYLSLQDSNATGGATWNTGPHSTDQGNVTGWVFSYVSVPGRSRPSAGFLQSHFQFFKNDGALNAATPHTTEDATSTMVNVGEVVRLRLQVFNNGNASGDIIRRLESKEDQGSWKQVLVGGNDAVFLVNSQYYTDGAPTDTRLTRVGNFMAGEGKNTTTDTAKLSLSSGSYTEDEYALMFSDAAFGHTYQFRISNAGAQLQAYLVTPIVTINTSQLTPFNINPQNNAILKTATPVITFSLNKTGECRASLVNGSFDDMVNATICTPVQSTFQRCVLPNLGSDGQKIIYLACKDASGNKDTASETDKLTYDLKASSHGTTSLHFKGTLQFLGKLIIR